MTLRDFLRGRRNKKDEQSREIEISRSTVERLEPIVQPVGEQQRHIVESKPSTSVAHVRRNGTPPPTKYIGIDTIDVIGNSEKFDTIIIQYPRATMITDIRDAIRKYAHKNSESIIGNFILVDIFVNITLHPDIVDPNKYNGNKWLRVVYESLDGNLHPTAITRFPDAMLIKVSESLGEPPMTLDKLIGGGKQW